MYTWWLIHKGHSSLIIPSKDSLSWDCRCLLVSHWSVIGQSLVSHWLVCWMLVRPHVFTSLWSELLSYFLCYWNETWPVSSSWSEDIVQWFRNPTLPIFLPKNFLTVWWQGFLSHTCTLYSITKLKVCLFRPSAGCDLCQPAVRFTTACEDHATMVPGPGIQDTHCRKGQYGNNITLYNK